MTTLFYVCGILLWVACAIEVAYQLKLVRELESSKQEQRMERPSIQDKSELQIEYTPMEKQQQKSYKDVRLETVHSENKIVIASVMKDHGDVEKRNLQYKNKENCTQKPVYGRLAIA